MATVYAYAKINLALDITGVRDDGYHTLRTVMQSVSLCDRVSLTDARPGEIEISCGGTSLPCGSENTVHRAAKAFFEYAGIRDVGASFVLEKRIPWQAGLGGDSADAAAAFRLLNHRYNGALTESEMLNAALSVGADVPFCLAGGTVLAEGIGERLTPLSPLPDCFVVLCKPSGGVSTQEAYARIDEENPVGTEHTDRVVRALSAGNLSEVGRAVGNLFETVAGIPDMPCIRTALLNSGALGACLSGSGSAQFGIFDSMEKAEACRTALLGRYPQTFLCRPVSHYGFSV